MRRRTFLALAGAAGASATAAFPRASFAQQAKLPRVAYLWNAGTPDSLIATYEQSLLDRGYFNGKNVFVETFRAMTLAELPGVAANAIASRPDVIVIHGTSVATALKTLSVSIPVVFGAVGDPVAAGLTTSLTRPSGYFTGASVIAPDLVGKQFQILKEMLPALRRIAALNAAGYVLTAIPQIPVAAAALGVEAVIIDLEQGKDITTQFDRVVKAAPQAVYAPSSVYLDGIADSITDLCISHALPLLWNDATTARRALVGYGPSVAAQVKKTGAYVDAILRGAKVADLPIEQPVVFDLAVNLNTARKIGVSIPTSILAQATQVIE